MQQQPIVDECARIETTELRDLARVIKAAIGVVTAYWVALGHPATHPYRVAAAKIVGYLSNRYDV